jgi:glutamate-1-semialdehyde 2,1-aminomutase
LAKPDTTTSVYEKLHPGSARLYEESLRTFPSGVTHDIRYLQPFPLFIDRAAGSRKWDVDGNQYVDYVMGHGALLMGHAHADITAAVVEQAGKGTHYGGNSRLELEWGGLVRRIVPSAEEVRFTSSGTEATLMAIRLARAYTGRDKILKFDAHFHGWHDAVSGMVEPESHSLISAGVPEATLSNTRSISQGDAVALEDELSEGDFAAVILEPTGASWGTIPLRPEFLEHLRDVTQRHSTVLIFDEVVTGFRVAPGGTQERYGIVPDLTTMAKILAGGLPGGAVAGKADVLSMIEFRNDQGWNNAQRVAHPGTFNANPLSAAAGSAMLRMVETGTHHHHADTLNGRLVGGLNDVLRRTGVPGCAYGLASYFHLTVGKEGSRDLNGIEWVDGGSAPPRMSGTLSMAMRKAMLNNGVDLMGGAGGFVSGVHSEQDIDDTIEAFEASVRSLRADGLV